MGRKRASWSLLVATLAVLTGCDKSPTKPAAPPLHRTVTVVVTDSLDAPAANVVLWWTSQGDSAGFARVTTATTDGGGRATVVLVEDEWGVHGHVPATRWVTGATFDVPGRSRPASDTVLVRLTLHSASTARGRVRLAGRTDHSGIVVACTPVPLPAITDTAGDYAIDMIPLGHWTITMFKTGFALGLSPIDATTPGEDIRVPDEQLISSP